MAERTERPIQEKALPFEGIGYDEQDGIIEGIAAVMGNVDRVGERIAQKALDRTIEERRAAGLLKLPMGVDHEYGFGVTLDLARVSRADLPADIRAAAPDATGGLYCKGQVVMSDENIALLGRLRSAAKPPTMSITYRVMAEEKSVTPRGTVIDLTELALNEWGVIVNKRAINQLARVTGMKAEADTGEKADIPPLPTVDAEEAALLDWAGRFAVEAKAGKVLSAKNLQDLSDAIDALTRIRKAAMGADAEEMPADMPAAAKAAPALTIALEPFDLAGWELDLLARRVAMATGG